MIGLYVHVPYCTVRCSYCDFFLMPGPVPDLSSFVEALRAEIVSVGRDTPACVADTAHFGGGTPSLLSPALLDAVLASLRSTFHLGPGAEIALEANPEDIDRTRLRDYAATGVNRLTIGVQSLEEDLLRLMGRSHDAQQAIVSVETARRSPVRSLGVDLIVGLPGQEAARALRGIARLVDLGVDHVSVYLLETHGTTRLGRELKLGRRTPMEDDEAARLYEAIADLLEENGFEHYEISNFARPGHRSRHNLKYWTDQDYLGFGPSAHSYAGGRRWQNAANLRAYLSGPKDGFRRVEGEPSAAARALEALLAGLRLAEGVDLRALRARYGVDFVMPDDREIDLMTHEGFLEADPDRLRLTRRGRLVSNEILERLLPGAPQFT